MPLRLRIKTIGSTAREAINLDREPSPAVMADGIGGVCRRGWQYWLEQHGCVGLQMSPNIVPREGSEVPVFLNIDTRGSFSTSQQRYRIDDRPAPTINAGALGPGNRQSHYWLTNEGEDDYVLDPSKPPYRVPTMGEIAALPWNGREVVSTFAGCGGSSLGYRMAGFRVLYANEFVDAAREVYALNARKSTIVDGRDIRQVEAQMILDAIGKQPGELDVLDGSPPCSDFSTAGKRSKGWGKVKKYSDREQRVDDLFFEYARLVDGIRPKVFVAENVSGLVKGVAKGYFLEILAALKEAGGGYDVEARLLDAQWLGVPQTRQRIIFVGVRRDLDLRPAHPSPLPHRYSVRDAIPWIVGARTKAHGFTSSDTLAPHKPAPTVPGRGGYDNGSYGGHEVEVTHVVEPESDISRFAIGEEADKLKPGQQSDRFFNLTRAHPDEPSPAVTATGATLSAASVIHPTEKRKFSIAELKRICAFPDDFQLTGTYGQQWERLGRAVPPVMMSHIASAIRDQVLAKIEDKPDVRSRRNVQPAAEPVRRRRSA